MKTPVSEVVLRRVTADDADLVNRWRTQPTTVRFQASPVRTLEQVREMLEEHAAVPVGPTASGRFSWIVLANGEAAGNIQYTINGDYDRSHHKATLGYMIAEEFQGRGIATAAVREVLRIGFDPAGLALERVEAVAAVENVGSRRVLERSGFTFEGILRKLLVIQGERVDHACYSRLITDN